MIRGGYRGKILRIDLTRGSISTEGLPDEGVLRKYVGNFGLGLWYLMKELPDGVGPLEPENPLIFLNGPLTGTRVPSPNNCTITTLNGDTAFTAGRSHTHGWFGPFLSMAGYDGIIVTGNIYIAHSHIIQGGWKCPFGQVKQFYVEQYHGHTLLNYVGGNLNPLASLCLDTPDDAKRFVDTFIALNYYFSSRFLADDAVAFADFQKKSRAWRALPARSASEAMVSNSR